MLLFIISDYYFFKYRRSCYFAYLGFNPSRVRVLEYDIEILSESGVVC